jgi:hypothetical protein
VSRWIDRYLAGEHEAVWAEMRALGAGIGEQRDASPEALEKLERGERAIGGRFPISVRAFIVYLGQVDFTGELGGWRPTYADELQVMTGLDGLEDSLLDTIEDRFFEAGDENAGRAFLDLSADHLHKANISGGSPYGVAVPDPSADALWLQDDLHPRHTFVQYLREAIADGGLPGWRRTSGDAPPPRLDELVEGLIGF